MTDSSLIYHIDGDASGLKKAMAESEAAHRKMVAALTAKLADIGAYKAAQAELARLGAALSEAKAKQDAYAKAAANASEGGGKLLAKDAARAEAAVARLTVSMQAQEARMSRLGQRLKAGGIDAGNLAAAENRVRASIQAANSVANAQATALARSAQQSAALRQSLDEVRSAGARLRPAARGLRAPGRHACGGRERARSRGIGGQLRQFAGASETRGAVCRRVRGIERRNSPHLQRRERTAD